MAKRDKRIEAMRRNPRTVRPDELDAALIAAGFTVQRQTGSHKIYAYGPYTLPDFQRTFYRAERVNFVAKP